jgi:hypothetical protein
MDFFCSICKCYILAPSIRWSAHHSRSCYHCFYMVGCIYTSICVDTWRLDTETSKKFHIPGWHDFACEEQVEYRFRLKFLFVQIYFRKVVEPRLESHTSMSEAWQLKISFSTSHVYSQRIYRNLAFLIRQSNLFRR